MTHFRAGVLVGFAAFYIVRFCIAEPPSAHASLSIADWMRRVDSVTALEVWR